MSGLKGVSTRSDGEVETAFVPKAEVADMIVVGDAPNGVSIAVPLEG